MVLFHISEYGIYYNIYKLIKCSIAVMRTLGAELILMELSTEMRLTNIIFKQKIQQEEAPSCTNNCHP